MVWPHVKEWMGVYQQEDFKYASAGKEKKGRLKKRCIAGQHQGWYESVQEHKIHGAESKCVARQHKFPSLTTQRGHICEKGEKYVIRWIGQLETNFRNCVRQVVAPFSFQMGVIRSPPGQFWYYRSETWALLKTEHGLLDLLMFRIN